MEPRLVQDASRGLRPLGLVMHGHGGSESKSAGDCLGFLYRKNVVKPFNKPRQSRGGLVSRGFFRSSSFCLGYRVDMPQSRQTVKSCWLKNQGPYLDFGCRV